MVNTAFRAKIIINAKYTTVIERLIEVIKKIMGIINIKFLKNVYINSIII